MKKTKEVASTTIIGAIVNIVVNVLLIKHIGLYAAAISTLLSYFVMMIYRYFDLKKYMKISFDKKSILLIVLVFIICIFMYYQKNIYINIISFVISVVFSYILNREMIKSSGKVLLNKLKILG